MDAIRWMLGMCDPERGKPPELREAEGTFTAAELSALHKQHASLVLERHCDLDDAALLQWAGLQAAPWELAAGVCKAVRRQQPATPQAAPSDTRLLPLAAIVIAKAKLEKMDEGTALDLMYRIMDPAGHGTVSLGHLQALLRGLLDLVLAGCNLPPQDTTKPAAALAAGASAISGASDLDCAAIVKWLKRTPPVREALRSLLANLQYGPVPPKDCLLSAPWLWLLSQAVSSELREEWQLIFNSNRHGMSFSTFMGRLPPEDAAPTLLLVRDKKGYLFGGVACEPWAKHGGFYGAGPYMECSLEPAAALYPASGINSNHQWCGVGFSELPNGIGFGGQKGHFGCWLDASFDHGMSRPNATFAAPCLASEQQFMVDAVECWLLKPPREDSVHSKKAGALNSAQEDQLILQLAGVHKGYSAGLKDEPLEED